MTSEDMSEPEQAISRAALQTHRELLIGLRNNYRGPTDRIIRRLQRHRYLLPDKEQSGMLQGQVMLVPTQWIWPQSRLLPRRTGVPYQYGAKVRVPSDQLPETVHLSYETAGQHTTAVSVYPGYGRWSVDEALSLHFPYSNQADSPLYIFRQGEEVGPSDPSALDILRSVERAVILADRRLLSD